ncbi:hypothetical protein FQR65_LT18739 [Abscondita terminalis]|nr:hypothetical protein FQR65_LT18739 [Abscondita terminalis]
MQNKEYIVRLTRGQPVPRAIIFNQSGEIAGVAQREFKQHYPQSGWVEHDPQDIWSTQFSVLTEALTKSKINSSKIKGIGITNQRETTVIWDRKTGVPIYNAIVWQDRRTAEYCRSISDKGHGSLIQKKTGLLIDAYFSASKINWILDNVKGARKKAEKGELAFGTIDTWLIWNLTNGETHVTDVTNASRTQLFYPSRRGVVANVSITRQKETIRAGLSLLQALGLAVFCGVVIAGPYSGAHLSPASLVANMALGKMTFAAVLNILPHNLPGAHCGACSWSVLMVRCQGSICSYGLSSGAWGVPQAYAINPARGPLCPYYACPSSASGTKPLVMTGYCLVCTRFPDQLKLKTHIPLLSELIDAAEAEAKLHRKSPMFYNIETKSSPKGDNILHPQPSTFVDLMVERNDTILNKMYPQLKSSYLIDGKNKQTVEELINDLGFTPFIISPNYSLVTKEFVTDCHARGIKVIPWTANTKEEIKRLKKLKVDGIISDYPNLL